MTPQELLRPRYIVIADYPGSFLRIGDILTDQQKDYEFWECNRDLSKFAESPAHYPDIFRPLNWWEHREEKDMPGYIKLRGDIYKVHEWDSGTGTPTVFINDIKREQFKWGEKYKLSPLYGDFTPATKEEYENQ